MSVADYIREHGGLTVMFVIEACRSEVGVPHAGLPMSREAYEDLFTPTVPEWAVESALEALALGMIAAHPDWEMSLDPADWTVVKQDDDPTDGQIRTYVLVPGEGAITT